MIDKAKLGAIIDSAYGYKKAINNFLTEQMLEDSNFELRGWYTFSDLNKLGLIIKGQGPTDNSWVHIENNSVVDYSLKFDDYVISYDEQNNKNIVTKGNLKENPRDYFLNTIDYYIDTLIVKNNPVYYNPITGNKCNVNDENENYVQNNSLIEFNGIIEGEYSTKTKSNQTSCLKWYKYSVNIDGTVNMMLDHNTSIDVQWYTSNNNEKAAETALQTMNGILENGNFTTIGDTSLWSNILERKDKYEATWYYNNKILKSKIDYIGYKARLITAKEIADITKASESSPIGIGFNEMYSTHDDWFFLDGSINQTLNTKWHEQIISGRNQSNYS